MQRSAVALPWLCRGFAVALLWLCPGSAVALPSLCRRAESSLSRIWAGEPDADTRVSRSYMLVKVGGHIGKAAGLDHSHPGRNAGGNTQKEDVRQVSSVGVLSSKQDTQVARSASCHQEWKG